MLAPADDYVAEFVRHMNPLDVLTGSMIMCERARMPAEAVPSGWMSGGAIACPLNGPARRSLCTSTGRAALRHVQDDAALAAVEPGLAVVPASFSLQSIIRLRQPTGHPVLLADGGKIVGVCGESEIIRALAGSRH